MVEILEAILVISFGISWPISIIKTLKSKTSAGKSPLFISLIIFGYICGIISKILNISQVAYSYYEIGKRSIPLELLIKLANYYDVSLDYITYRTNKKNRF